MAASVGLGILRAAISAIGLVGGGVNETVRLATSAAARRQAVAELQRGERAIKGALFNVTTTTKGNTSKLDRLIQNLKRVERAGGGPFVRVGIFENEKLAKIGAIHEFGAPSRRIPQRSFLRQPFTKGDPNVLDAFRRTGEFFFQQQAPLSKSFRKAKLGQAMVNAVRKGIDAGIKPALRPETIAKKSRKGSSTPDTALRDTSALYNAITWKITKKADD